jgi:UDP-N-acetylglucosamine--N-acetylmuramyl-(pentapeptide) pyrophosphoryl-undecaprenol N-acetylglucosamine transferase
MNTILFTGGGSAGHVTPNLALIKKFLDMEWQVIYVGSKSGMEKEIIQQLKIPYYGIASGKLRRYFSWRTFIEPFVVLLGIIQAFGLCRKLKPQIVFSKGGFVAFPVVVGAWLNKIPVVVHESDLTPGLANRLSFPFAKKICVTFPEGKKYFTEAKVIVTGTPIRESLLRGDVQKGRDLCGFSDNKPILLIMGGGLGSALINNIVRQILPKLLSKFQVVHLCGTGKIDNEFNSIVGYAQFEYLNTEISDIYACADLVVSRAGANTLYELLYLKKPHLLIPLSKNASRGDQIVNAQYFVGRGLSHVLYEEELDAEKLLAMLINIYKQKDQLCQIMTNLALPDSNQIICSELTNLATHQPDRRKGQ